MKTKPTTIGCRTHHENANYTPHLRLTTLFTVLLLIINPLINMGQNALLINGRIVHQTANGRFFSMYNNGADTVFIGNTFLTVKFQDGQVQAGKTAIEALGLIPQTSSSDYFVYKLPSDFNLLEITQRVNNLSFVEKSIFDILGTPSTKPNPNDPESSSNLNFWIGDPNGDASTQYLNLLDAWEYTTGNPDVRVAILDNGNDWSQTDDMPANNNIGYNFWENNRNTQIVCAPIPLTTHGAEITSLICSKTNNGKGIFGVAGGWTSSEAYLPGVTPIIYKVANSDQANLFPKPSLALLPAAIDSAVARGANVILTAFNYMNLTEAEMQPFKDAVNRTLADPCNKVTFIASSGNYSGGQSQNVYFPASYPPVIAVAGVNSEHFLDGSCWGENLDFVTGARAITNKGHCYSLTNPYGENLSQGTSIAASLLAGVVSLMYSVNPDLTNDQVFDILKQSCYKTTNYGAYVNRRNDHVGYGFPNAKIAIEKAMELKGYEINGVVEWVTNKNYGTITVNPDAKLILTGMTLGMTTDASIIIRPGGKLIANYSTITNACPNKPWKGIQVWGDKAKNQYLNSQGNYWQGYLELNNSTVSNARVAVDLWKPKDYAKTGGIVKATGSHFINNANAVHVLRYKNTHPINGMETNYIAQFNNCDFLITTAYFAANKTFYKHIDLDHVKGPSFSGCDFTLAPNVNNVSSWNQAIASYSSGFSLTGRCASPIIANCTNFQYSHINGFRWGINSNYDKSNLYTYTVNRAIFENNVYGILNNVVKSQKVINSKFYLGNANAQYSTDCNFGIYMNSSNAFTIENNEFFKMAGAPQAVYTGIFTANTNAMDDIYRNTFNGMSFGNLATKQNWIGNELFKGLEYLCNINTNNWSDFYVYNGESGMQDQQGGYTVASGNKFSASATWHFYNTKVSGNHEIGYYYNQNAPLEIPDINKVNYVTIHGIDYCNTCPDHFGNIINVSALTTAEIDLLTITHNNAKAQLEELDILYNQLTDGGSTPIKLSEIQAANETQMWSLRDNLLANSPYLTDTVLRQVAGRTDIFPDAIIFEILAANPEALRNRNLIIYLAEKTNPLPEYMINILEQVAGQNSTYKSILQHQMAQYAREATKVANTVIDSYLNDTILDVASLNTWLIKKGGIEADKQRVALMIANNDFTGAMALAEDLPDIYSLSHEALDNYTAWFDLLSLQKALHDSNRDWSQLTETERTYLETVAYSYYLEAAAIAQGILSYNYNTGFDHCFDIDEPDALKHKAITPQDMAKAYGMTIEVNPNPAREWTAFTYTLPVNEKSGEIIVSDMQGRKVFAITVSEGRGQKIWDTRTYTPGAYIYTFKSGKFNLSGKVLISK